MDWLAILFCACLGLFLYNYLGYPILLFLLSKLCKHKKTRSYEYQPAIDLIIPAHNEADVIEQKIRSVLDSSYPRDKINVIVVCDGCDDTTAEQARKAGARLVLEIPRSGKCRAINEAVAASEREILVFSDANAFLLPSSLSELVAPFADSAIGAVAGEQRIGQDVGAEGIYWRYEALLKRMEDQVCTVAGSDGSLHAIRRTIFRPLPTNRLIMDDLMMSLQAPINKLRIAYAPNAIAIEGTSPNWSREFSRKIRILVGSLNVLIRSKRALLNPGFLFSFISHKLIRYLGPFLLLIPSICGFFLWHCTVLFWLHIMLLSGLFIGCIGLLPMLRKGLFKQAGYFVLTQAALLLGWWKLFAGNNRPTWEKLR